MSKRTVIRRRAGAAWAAAAILALLAVPVEPAAAQQGPDSANVTMPNTTALGPASGSANAQRDEQMIAPITNQTIDQFNAANAESRRFSETQSGLRNQALQMRKDQAQSALGCQAIGGAGGAACSTNLGIANRQQQLQLHNDALQQLNMHNSIQRGLGRPPSL